MELRRGLIREIGLKTYALAKFTPSLSHKYPTSIPLSIMSKNQILFFKLILGKRIIIV